TIDRPEARNALDMYHFRDLAQAWRDFKNEPDAWVAIITGTGDAFMAGADLKTFIPQVTELQKRIAAGEVKELDGCRLSDSTYAVLRNVKLFKPIIAAVGGPCVAGGMEMLGGLALDLEEAYKLEQEISSKVFQTEDAKEGPRAFAEKRAPTWQAK